MPWSIAFEIYAPGYSKDYEAHSHQLNCDDYRTIWSAIRDCYDDFTHKCQYNAIHRSWEKLATTMRTYRVLRQYSMSMFSDEYTSYLPSIPVELAFVDALPSTLEDGVEYCLEDLTDPTGHTYFIPERFRTITRLQDFLNSPINMLALDVDYTLDIEVRKGYEGRIIFNDGVVWSSTMWAQVYQLKAVEDLIERFGVMVDYDDLTHEETETFNNIHALLQLQQHGPIFHYLELGISVINDWPFTFEACSVVAKAADDSWLRVRPRNNPDAETYVITNATGLPLMKRGEDWAWTPIVVKDNLEAWRALTEAAEVHDIYEDPDLTDHFMLTDIEAYHRMVVDLDDGLPTSDITMPYSFRSGPLLPGVFIVGGLSGATADVIGEDYDATTDTGTLTLDNLVRNFWPGEVITGIWNFATADGPAVQTYEVVDPVALVKRNKKSTAFADITYHMDWTPDVDAMDTTHGDYPLMPECEMSTTTFDYPLVPVADLLTTGYVIPAVALLGDLYTTHGVAPASPLGFGLGTTHHIAPEPPIGFGVSTDYP